MSRLCKLSRKTVTSVFQYFCNHDLWLEKFTRPWLIICNNNIVIARDCHLVIRMYRTNSRESRAWVNPALYSRVDKKFIPQALATRTPASIIFSYHILPSAPFSTFVNRWHALRSPALLFVCRSSSFNPWMDKCSRCYDGYIAGNDNICRTCR